MLFVHKRETSANTEKHSKNYGLECVQTEFQIELVVRKLTVLTFSLTLRKFRT